MTDDPFLPEVPSQASPVVLVVEDEFLIRLIIADTLRDQGYVVLEAADPAEALTLFEATEPIHLVVTDVKMPGTMDGVALAREIRKSQSRLPILMVSGHMQPEDVVEADRFLRKPFNSEQLVRAAKELIGFE